MNMQDIIDELEAEQKRQQADKDKCCEIAETRRRKRLEGTVDGLRKAIDIISRHRDSETAEQDQTEEKSYVSSTECIIRLSHDQFALLYELLMKACRRPSLVECYTGVHQKVLKVMVRKMDAVNNTLRTTKPSTMRGARGPVRTR